MTGYDTGYQIGYWGSSIAGLCFLIWIIWAIWRYKPFSKFVQMAYDLRNFIIQVVLMYSNKPSMFSVKRFHNGLITYWALITASLFIRSHPEMKPAEFMLIIGPFLGKGVYDVYQSQQDKKMNLAMPQEQESTTKTDEQSTDKK